MKFDNRIREHRKRARYSMQELADAIGTTKQTIGKLETGEIRLSVEWMHKIAPVLSVKMADLLPPDQSEAA